MTVDRVAAAVAVVVVLLVILDLIVVIVGVVFMSLIFFFFFFGGVTLFIIPFKQLAQLQKDCKKKIFMGPKREILLFRSTLKRVGIPFELQ